MECKFKVNWGVFVFVLVCTVVLYFGIRFVDIPLVTFSTILLVLVAFVSLIALVVWWGAKRLEVTNIQSDIFGFAGENLRVCYSFDFAFPIPFFYFRLKPEITELYSVDSHEFSLRTCNEAFFYLFFFRRCNCSLKFDLEIRNVLSVLTIKLESALSLRSVISPRKIFSVDNQETPQLAEGDMLASVGIGQGDPLNLRPYHPGDSMRRIAWKIFAKKRELVVRELEKNLTDSKDVILLVDPLVSDDPLVNLVLEFVKNLKNAECNLAYCTTVSGKIFEDFERFREELLESGNNGFRVSLERLFNENFLEFSQKALVVALSDDLRNQAKFSLLRSFSGGISMEFLIGPTVAKKSSLRKYVFKNDLDFELRYDKACSVLLA